MGKIVAMRIEHICILVPRSIESAYEIVKQSVECIEQEATKMKREKTKRDLLERTDTYFMLKYKDIIDVWNACNELMKIDQDKWLVRRKEYPYLLTYSNDVYDNIYKYSSKLLDYIEYPDVAFGRVKIPGMTVDMDEL